MLVTAAGLATAGLIPFASTFAIFATGRAWEQLRNSVCYPSLNVKLVATHGGITVGQDGGSHQAVEDLAVTRVIPNLTVIVPADGPETAQVIEAVARREGPVYVRLPRGAGPDVNPPGYRYAVGKAPQLRDGGDLTLAACGLMVDLALRAARRLAAEHALEARVLNVSTLKPLDTGALEAAARETGALVTIEEHSVIGGLGAAVCEAVCGCCPAPVLRLGMQDQFGQSGAAEELLEHYGLTEEAVVARALEAVAMKGRQ
jgi:transketolase